PAGGIISHTSPAGTGCGGRADHWVSPHPLWGVRCHPMMETPPAVSDLPGSGGTGASLPSRDARLSPVSAGYGPRSCESPADVAADAGIGRARVVASPSAVSEHDVLPHRSG